MSGTTYTEQVLVSFDYTDGADPLSTLITDASGDLFGTTELSGGQGEVFEVTYSPVTGYASTPTILGQFSTTTGTLPFAGVTMDSNGDLFGTTYDGGANGKGTVFEVAYSAATGYSAPTALASFTGAGNQEDGAHPTSALITDAAGDLFGTTGEGGQNDDGVVFEMVKTANVYAAPTVLYNFTGGGDGADPYAGLVADSKGDLFGTTTKGGSGGDGVAFEIVKTGATYAASPTVLVTFPGSSGGTPYGSLIFDSKGDLFGTTFNGGANGDGVVFEIAKAAASPTGYASTPTVLYSFSGADGAHPDDALTIDANGDLYGTTRYGGNGYVSGNGDTGDGVVFEIAKDGSTATGYAATENVLYSFSGADGANPDDSVVITAAGDLLLTTTNGGAHSDGAIVELTPVSPPCYCRGARILTERGEVAVEDLRAGDFVVTAGGEMREIVWIGHRDIEVARHAFPLEILPVRVRAGAFGPGLPHRDLWLSPQHAVFNEGVLIPIIKLANGANVAQVRVDTVSYFHVELQSHDLLIAEGLPAESFLDCGSRAGFSNAEACVELHPTFRPLSSDDACAPLREAGAEVESVRARLAARAVAQGFRRSADPGLHVLADGRMLWPDADGFAFTLPPGARELKLMSRHGRPADDGASADLRRLGVAVSAIEIDGAALPLETLGAGWHPLEQDDGRSWRWTDGCAALPSGGRRLRVTIAGAPLHWIEPAAALRARAAA